MKFARFTNEHGLDTDPPNTEKNEAVALEWAETLLYLPPYSPDLNLIEEAFSEIKALLRRAGARIREALVEAIGRVLDTVTARDARSFFEHCGYRLPSQPLLQPL